MIYHTADPGDPMFVADRSGANAVLIFIHPRPGGHNHYPVWSPDGRWTYFVSGTWATYEMDLWRIAPSGEEPERFTNQNNDVTYPALIDARTALYLSPAGAGSGPSLWALDVESKVTRRVSFGLEEYTSLTASADGRQLAATVRIEDRSPDGWVHDERLGHREWHDLRGRRRIDPALGRRSKRFLPFW